MYFLNLFLLTDFFSFSYEVYSLASLVIVRCMPNIMNLTLLNAGYFSISLNILELCSRMLLNYLELV